MTPIEPKITDILGVKGMWGLATCVLLYPDDHIVVEYALGKAGPVFGDLIKEIRVFVMGKTLGVAISRADGSEDDPFVYTGDFAVSYLGEPVEDEAALFEVALDLCSEWRPR